MDGDLFALVFKMILLKTTYIHVKVIKIST